MKKVMLAAVFGLALCLLANVAWAAGLAGTYTYRLVVRDDFGFVLSGCEPDLGDERVTEYFALEVYSANGTKIDATVSDVSVAQEGYNCALAVPVSSDGEGCAAVGEQLTLVVIDRYLEGERFRSSKVLPPVGGSFGATPATIAVFFSDAEDVDFGWDLWRWSVESYAGMEIGGPDDDFDEDRLPNLREYQLGTDPLGGALGLHDTPEFKISEQDAGYVVEFNFDYCHVYSIRVISGNTVVGKDGLGEDLELREVDDADASCGRFVYEADSSGRRRCLVQKPSALGYCIGLAVDGRLLEYVTVEPKCYAVTFDANGGSGSMAPQELDPMRVYNLSKCTLTPPEGMRFAGWACSNGRRYDDGMLVFGLAELGQTVKMTAIWESAEE